MGKHQYKGVNDGGRGIPALIVDLLETHFGSWFTIHELAGEICLHRPDHDPDKVEHTVTRAIHRLMERGVIEHRKIDYHRSYQTALQVRCGWRDYWEREEAHDHVQERTV